MKTSPLFAFTIVSLATPIVASDLAESAATPEFFEFGISGVLVGKLEEGTVIQFWNPNLGVERDTFRLEDLPVKLPFQTFGNQFWHVEFISPSQRESVFSVTLSHALFDRPRKIDLKLEKPVPHIRPFHAVRLHYTASVTRRMRYRDLPYWDERQNKLVSSPPPVISVFRVKDGVKLAETEMTSGCWASKWWGWFDESVDFGEGTDLRFVVRYHSGGLFEPIETKLDFTYHSWLHGR